MIGLLKLKQAGLFKSFLGVILGNTAVAEVDANITGFFDIVTALLTQVLTWLTQMTTWVMGNNLASLFFAIMLLMLAIHVLHSLIKFS